MPQGVRNLFWYYSWWGAVEERDFHIVLREPLQQFCKQQMLELLKGCARALDTGSVEGGRPDLTRSLTRSQFVVQNPWIVDFIDSLGPSLERNLSIEPPEHLVKRVYALFDANADGKITKAEFISKVSAMRWPFIQYVP